MSGGSGGGGFLYWARRVRIVFAIVCGLPFLVLVIWAGLSSYLGDPTDLVVAAPETTAVTVTIDADKNAVDAGHFGSWKVQKGDHHVHVESADGRALQDVDVHVGRGFEKYTIVPVKGQCFVVYDVADAWYGATARKGVAPKVVSRSSDARPFEEPNHQTYLFTTQTPASVEEGDKVLLVLETRCDDVRKKTDTDLIADAGLIR